MLADTTGYRANVVMECLVLGVTKFIAVLIQIPMVTFTGRELPHFAAVDAAIVLPEAILAYWKITVVTGLSVGQEKKHSVAIEAKSLLLSWKS